MAVQKPDDIFDILANVDALNLFDDADDIYDSNMINNISSSDAMYKLLLSEASQLGDVSVDTIEAAMDKIIWHESRGKVDEIQLSHQFETDPQGNYVLDNQGNRIKMKDPQGNYMFTDGPGRGLFQYELSSLGGSGAGRTAFRRLYNQMGGNLIKGERPENILPFMDQYLPENQWGHHDMETSSQGFIDIDFSKLSETDQKILFLVDKLQAGVDFSDIGIDTGQWWLDHHKKSGDQSAYDESMKSYNKP